MSLCWPLRMPPTAKAVLISLADHAGDDGQCWPSIDTICDRTCFGRDAVIDAVAWLEGSGAVKANRENGRKTTYCITPADFNSAYSRPSRRTVSRASTSRAEPPPPVGQTDSHQSGRATGLEGEPVGQSDRSDDVNQSGKTIDQSGKTAKPVGQPDTNNQEPSLNNQSTVAGSPGLDLTTMQLQGFLVFYAAYPRKVNRPAAFKAWKRLKPDEALQAQILAAVALQRKHPDWTKENRKFVPHPASYLNGRRWEDEILGASPPVGQTDWFREAGFTHVAEAQNARCHIGNYREFRDGKRIAEGVTA